MSAAQQPRTLPVFALERLHFDTSGMGSLVVGTGRSLEPGVARVSVQSHYERLPLNFARTWDPGITSVSLVENKLTGQLTAAVGVRPWLQVGTHLAYILGQQGQSVLGMSPPNGGGLEAAWASARVAPWRTRDGSPLNVAAELTAALPVGQARLLGREAYLFLPRLQAGIAAEGYQVGGEVSLLLRPRQDFTALTSRPHDVLGNEVRLGATVTSRGENDTATRPEVSMLLNLPLQGGRPSAEFLVGVRKHLVPSVDLFFLGGPGVGTAIDLPTLRLLVGASFVTAEAD
ncbi:OmpA domain protein [Melittangium boletus DSM 14713]|uniref:OmpA domain protein n=2 Tax=Melittangium boletus TaxID=83453 RepID=A0A250IGB2_9BACT|nr:OmpA domain protein [Melittangium boletus DSM 14713]